MFFSAMLLPTQYANACMRHMQLGCTTPTEVGVPPLHTQVAVALAMMLVYTSMQTFAIPGTLTLSMLAGALYGPLYGLLYVSGTEM